MTAKQTKASVLGRPNSLGMGQRELTEIIDEFDAQDGGRSHRQREYVRWPYRQRTVEVTVKAEGGYEISIFVACRNLSNNGIAILHSAYMHPGTKCRLFLPRTDSEAVPINGKVVRCAHRRDMIHEVGIEFTELINVMEFVNPDQFCGAFSMECVDPESLEGTIVHIDGSEPDQRIVRHFLRETRVDVRSASSAAEGEALVQEGCDLVLCDLLLPDDTGIELLVRMRESGVQTPWILMTSDTSADTKTLLLQSSANAFLPKPLAEDAVLRAAAEYLRLGVEKSDDRSTLCADDPAAGLVDGYIEDLRKSADAIEAAFEAGNAEETRRLCLALKGNAPTFGFEVIGRLASDLVDGVAGDAKFESLEHEIRSLVTKCRRAQSIAA